MTSASLQLTHERPAVNPWLVSIAVMLATFMEVLDTSVANVSLPHIAGSLSASTEESTWVLTSYLVSNAIVLPATGWLGNFFGRKRFLLACIALFTFSSCLCGLAPNLGTLIFARVLQGVGGGALQPISQAVLLESFPKEKRGMAMAVFALGVVVAPIIGPTLGGWITDNYSWHWIFLINLPIGLLSIVMVKAYIHDPDYIGHGEGHSIDYIGLGFMVVWLALLQIVLDKGQQADWFGSSWIVVATIISTVAMFGFIIRELSTRYPIVDLRILANRNFAIGVFLITVTGAILYGSIAMLPIYLQGLMGYTAFLAGMVLSPRGIGALVTSSMIGRIIGKFDDRYLIAIGFLLLGISNFWLGYINLQISFEILLLPVILNGVAISFIFVPLTTTTLGTLEKEQMGNATGIFNLMRNLGGGFGISILITLIARGAQVHQSSLSSQIMPYDPVFQARLQALQQKLSSVLGQWQDLQLAPALIYQELVKQANLLSFVDNFRRMGFLALLCVPVVFFFKRPKNIDKDMAMMH